MLRVLQIGCVLALVLVLWLATSGYRLIATNFEVPSFTAGFFVGALLIVGIWLLNDKLDASSRPRGSSTKK